jgi:hypothetical protein
MIFMFKFKNDLLPSLFNNYFSENRNYHRYPTRNALQLRIPKVKTKIANTFIKKSGVAVWNKMEADLFPFTTSSMGVFKTNLIKQLIANYKND